MTQILIATALAAGMMAFLFFCLPAERTPQR